MHKSSIRWLLRVLCDAPFLRVYIEAADETTPPPLSSPEVEHLFWAMPADTEHCEGARRQAWRILQKSIVSGPLSAPIFFQRIQGLIKQELLASRGLSQLPSFYGLDFLFPDAGSRASPISSDYGFVETHAHFRGSVPIATLWQRLMADARLRAHHRGDLIECGAWSMTRAEVLDLAHRISHAAPTAPIQASAIAYLAIRGNFGRHLTVQRGEVGLTPFTKAYGRYSGAAKRRRRSSIARTRAIDDIAQVIATLDEFRDRGVRSVELRPTAELTRTELQAKLRPLILGYLCHIHRSLYPMKGEETREPVDFGIVLSLYKQEIAGDVAKREDHIDGSTRTPWARRQSALWQRQIRGILDVIKTVPALRLFIVGIDAAGREQGCPVRNFGAAFDVLHAYHHRHGLADRTPGRRIRQRWTARLREQIEQIEQSRGERGPDGPDELAVAQQVWDDLCKRSTCEVPPCRLGLTMHVGEDFCDPITGLREIWDALVHLKLRPGDRLGHALAAALNRELLGVLLEGRAKSSNRFVEKIPGTSNNFRVTKPVGVHLLDEAWQATLLNRSPIAPATYSLSGQLLHAAARASSIPSETQALSHHLTQAIPATISLPGLHFAELEMTPPDLLTQITVDDDYYRRFELLRQQVLRRICGGGIFVESCPTSNIVVAGLSTPPLKVFLDEIPENVTIASDDPAIFNAWPDDELERHGQDQETRLLLARNSYRAAFL